MEARTHENPRQTYETFEGLSASLSLGSESMNRHFPLSQNVLRLGRKKKPSPLKDGFPLPRLLLNLCVVSTLSLRVVFFCMTFENPHDANYGVVLAAWTILPYISGVH